MDISRFPVKTTQLNSALFSTVLFFVVGSYCRCRATDDGSVLLASGLVHVTFSPYPLVTEIGKSVTGLVNVSVRAYHAHTTARNYTVHASTTARNYTVHACCADLNTVEVLGSLMSPRGLHLAGSSWTLGNISARGVRVGDTAVRFFVTSAGSRGQWWLPGEYRTQVVLPDLDPLGEALEYAVRGLVGLGLVFVGGRLDVWEMVELVRRPTAVSIGLVSRYCVIPTICLCVAELLSSPGHVTSLSVLAAVCSPPDGAVCLLALLAKLDLALTVTLVVIAQLLALGAVPVWTLVFQQLTFVPDHSQLGVPVRHAFLNLLTTVSLLACGRHLQANSVKLRAFARSYESFLASLALIATPIVLVYNNYLVLNVAPPRTVVLSGVATVASYTLSFVLGVLGCQTLSCAFVLGLEVGFRTSVPVGAIDDDSSLGRLDRDLGRLGPVLMGLGGWGVGVVVVGVARYCRRRQGGLDGERRDGADGEGRGGADGEGQIDNSEDGASFMGYSSAGEKIDSGSEITDGVFTETEV